jgi:hypothetical protein
MSERQSIEEMLTEEIRSAENTSVLIVLARLCHGKISQKYDELIEAWKYKCPQLRAAIAKLAVEAVLEQKQEAEAMAEEMAKRDEAMLAEVHRRGEAEAQALYGPNLDDSSYDSRSI